MGNTIDITRKLELKRRSNFMDSCTKTGMGGAELEVFAQLYDAFFESETELNNRFSNEERVRRAYIVRNLIPNGQGYKLHLDTSLGLFQLVRSAQAVSEELKKPIQLIVPMICSDSLPPVGTFEYTIAVGSPVKAHDICDQFHRRTERAALDYLESPKGRRMMMTEANRPNPKNTTDWSGIVEYLRERVTLG